MCEVNTFIVLFELTLFSHRVIVQSAWPQCKPNHLILY